MEIRPLTQISIYLTDEAYEKLKELQKDFEERNGFSVKASKIISGLIMKSKV